jgi:lipopolysaccharide exporter
MTYVDRQKEEVLNSSGTKLDLTDQSLHGIKWNYIGVAGRVLAQVLTQITLARLLGPETLGIFATCFLVVGLFYILVDLGLGAAIIQAKTIQKTDIRFSFTLLITSGIIATLFLFFAADTISDFFKNKSLSIVLQAMAPSILLSALVTIPLALLRRQFSYKTVLIGDLSSYIISYAFVGNFLAWYGFGIWALVAAIYVQTILTCAYYTWMRPYNAYPTLQSDGVDLQFFGLKILLTNLMNWIIENFDRLIIGKVIGAHALGLYSVSYNLVRTPANHLITSIQSVLFPAASRAQDDLSRLKRAYLSVVAAIAVATLPTFFTVAVVSVTLVNAIFGAAWSEAAPLIKPLALAMAAHSLMAVAGPILAGRGQPGVELKIQFWTAILFAVVLYKASQLSIVIAAWTVAAVYLFRAIWMTTSLLRSLNISIYEFSKALRGAILLTIIVAPATFLLDLSLSSEVILPIYRLALDMTFSFFLCAASLYLMPRYILSTDLSLLINRIGANSKFYNNLFLFNRIRDFQE